METLGSHVSDADFFTQFILKKHRAALDLLSAIKQIGTIDPMVALVLHAAVNCSTVCKLVNLIIATPPCFIILHM